MSQHASHSFLRRVLPGAGWLSVAPLVNRTLGFLTLPIMTYYLSPEDYGILAITALVVGIVGILADWGHGVGLTRNYLDYSGEGLREFLFTIVVAVAFVSGLLYGAAFILGPSLAQLLTPEWRGEFAIYLRLQVIATGLTATQAVTTNYLLIAQRVKKFAALQVVTNVIMVALQLVLLIVFELGLLAIYYARVASGLAMLLIGITLIWHDMKPVFRPQVIRDIWNVGWATLPIAVLGYLVRLGDRWVLQALLPLSTLGLYNFGARFEDMYLAYNNSIKGAWKPTNLRMLKESSSDRLLRSHADYLLEISLLVMAGIALFSKEVIYLLVDDRFRPAHVVVPILVLGAMLRGISIIPYNRLIFEKKVPYALLTLIPSSITEIGLAWLLIPKIGLAGAAIGSTAAWAVNSMVQTIWALRVTERGVQVSVRRWMLLLALAVVVSVVGVFLPADTEWIGFGLKLGLFTMIVAVVLHLERQQVHAAWQRTFQRYFARG